MKADITMLLDRTGSMASVKHDTIGGFNTFIEAQKREPGECLLTLVQFDDIDPQEIVHNAVRMQNIPPLTDETFVPRGSTPLLDALGKAIVRTGERLKGMPEAARPEKVIFVVLTDGQENASHEYSRQQVFDMITHQRDRYKWEFVFLGSNQDAIAEANQIGIPATAALTYNADNVAASYTSASANVARMRSGGLNMFSEDDRKKAVQPKRH